MERSTMERMLRDALAIDDDFKRAWAFSEAVVRLGPVEELEAARDFVQSEPALRARVPSNSAEFQLEIDFRYAWSGKLSTVDEALSRYPRVARRADGVGHKVALLRFADFCSCEVWFACEMIQMVLAKLETRAAQAEFFGSYLSGPWPKNHFGCVMSALAMFTQRQCWVVRHLFLSEVKSAGCDSEDRIYFATHCGPF